MQDKWSRLEIEAKNVGVNMALAECRVSSGDTRSIEDLVRRCAPGWHWEEIGSTTSFATVHLTVYRPAAASAQLYDDRRDRDEWSKSSE